jgi:hypothetical protein
MRPSSRSFVFRSALSMGPPGFPATTKAPHPATKRSRSASGHEQRTHPNEPDALPGHEQRTTNHAPPHEQPREPEPRLTKRSQFHGSENHSLKFLSRPTTYSRSNLRSAKRHLQSSRNAGATNHAVFSRNREGMTGPTPARGHVFPRLNGINDTKVPVPHPDRVPGRQTC